MAYVYCADIFCDDCGKSINDRMDRGDYISTNPDKEDYPQYCDGTAESDCPQHCGAGSGCLNAIELSDGSKIGVWLENELTSDGEAYVIDAVCEGGEVADLWREWYNWIDFPDEEVCRGWSGLSGRLDANGYCPDCGPDDPDCPDYPESCPGVHDCPDYPDACHNVNRRNK